MITTKKDSSSQHKNSNASGWASKRSLLAVIIGFLITISAFLGITLYEGEFYLPNVQDTQKAQEVEVVKVTDGDTIKVKDLENDKVFRVRYLGIDTPELEGPGYKSCFGDQAKKKNEDLVQNQKLLLEFDQDKYDRFGRTLAYVYTLNDSGEKDIFVNLKLLEDGYARFYFTKQNTLWQEEFVQAALLAHQDCLGLWGSCGESQFDEKCLIKGNVSRLGHKYYHLPGDKYYAQTKVNLLKEDQWLCTIEEAEAKNFQRALK